MILYLIYPSRSAPALNRLSVKSLLMTLTTQPPLGYRLARLLFQVLLRVFFHSVIVENEHFIPESGHPCIVCANHGNSITDAVVLVGTIPKCNMLRLTAKSTLFGKKSITSFVMESAGAVPIKRKKDYAPGTALDNSESMETIKQVLEHGSAVCIFPEGGSRFHPSLAPMKTGVAWLVSDLLKRNKDNMNFQVSILLCSINYTHRQLFRSDVAVTYHPPLVFDPVANVDLYEPATSSSAVHSLCERMHSQLASGLAESPTWDILRSGKAAARFAAVSYLPRQVGVSGYMKLARWFTKQMVLAETTATLPSSSAPINSKDIAPGSRSHIMNESRMESLAMLRSNLKDLERELHESHLPSAILIPSISRQRIPLPLPTSLHIDTISLALPILFLPFALPGLLSFWGPTFLIAQMTVSRFLRSGGAVEDTFDEIAHRKIVSGLLCGIGGATSLLACGIYVLCTQHSSSGIPTTLALLLGVPTLEWYSLRILEDGVVAMRAWLTLARLRAVDECTMAKLRRRREAVVEQISLACADIGD